MVDALDCANQGDIEKALALLEDARFCCHRAQHDAIDAALSKIGIDLDDLTRRLGFEAVLDGYPNFREFFAQFALARRKVAGSRLKREDRNAIYSSIVAVDLPALIEHYENLMAVRPLAKSSALRRRLGSIQGTILMVAAIAAAIFAGLAVDWDKVLGAETVVEAPKGH